MTESDDGPARPAATHHLGLVSRLVGVLLTPRRTFGDVVRQAKWLGALTVVTLTMASFSAWLVNTALGQQMLIEQQVGALESFGISVTDELYDQMAGALENSAYLTAGGVVVFIPILALLVSGSVWTVCYVLLGAHVPFRAMYAVVAHVGVVNMGAAVFRGAAELHSRRDEQPDNAGRVRSAARARVIGGSVVGCGRPVYRLAIDGARDRCGGALWQAHRPNRCHLLHALRPHRCGRGDCHYPDWRLSR